MIKKIAPILFCMVMSTSAMFSGKKYVVKSATVYPEVASLDVDDDVALRRKSMPVYKEVYQLILISDPRACGELVYDVVREGCASGIGSFHVRTINNVVAEFSDMNALGAHYNVVLNQAIAWATTWHYRQMQILPNYLQRDGLPKELITALQAHGFVVGEKQRWIKNLGRS